MIRKRRNVLVGPFGTGDDDFSATKAKPVSVEDRKVSTRDLGGFFP